MKSIFVLTVAATQMAAQAQALSCMAPDIARAFEWASQADESYIILNGEFTFDDPAKGSINQLERVSTQMPAVFNGRYLGAEGFVAAPPLDVTLNFKCFGPWCGSIESGAGNIIVFAQQSTAGYVVEIDPCYSTLFAPDDSNIQRIEDCMRGDECDPIPF